MPRRPEISAAGPHHDFIVGRRWDDGGEAVVPATVVKELQDRIRELEAEVAALKAAAAVRPESPKEGNR